MIKRQPLALQQAFVLSVLATSVVTTTQAAAQLEFSVFASRADTKDLGHALGAGARIAFPLRDHLSADLSISYYEDFSSRSHFGDEVAVDLGLELSYLPADFGLTWKQDPKKGLQVGLGLTWAYLDFDGLAVAGVDPMLRGDADNEFGAYLRVSYRTRGGLWLEAMYRSLEVSIEDLTIFGRPPSAQFIASDFDLTGLTINVGYSF